MLKTNKYISILVFTFLAFTSCKSLKVDIREENKTLPESYVSNSNAVKDTTNSAALKWRDYFTDEHLVALIDTALNNNQELNIIRQEIEMSRNEIRAKKGEYLPRVSGYVGAGADKVSRYSRNGALEATTDIEPGKAFPEPLQDYTVGFQANWEIDVWMLL